MSPYWRSLEHLQDTPEFRDLMHREFPEGITDPPDEVSRRDFLKWVGGGIVVFVVGFSLLERFVGRYRTRDARLAIEREGAELFLRRTGEPRRPLIALSTDEVRLRDQPVRLRRATDARGRSALYLTEHPDRPVVVAVRVSERP